MSHTHTTLTNYFKSLGFTEKLEHLMNSLNPIGNYALTLHPNITCSFKRYAVTMTDFVSSGGKWCLYVNMNRRPEQVAPGDPIRPLLKKDYALCLVRLRGPDSMGIAQLICTFIRPSCTKQPGYSSKKTRQTGSFSVAIWGHKAQTWSNLRKSRMAGFVAALILRRRILLCFCVGWIITFEVLFSRQINDSKHG